MPVLEPEVAVVPVTVPAVEDGCGCVPVCPSSPAAVELVAVAVVPPCPPPALLLLIGGAADEAVLLLLGVAEPAFDVELEL